MLGASDLGYTNWYLPTATDAEGDAHASTEGEHPRPAPRLPSPPAHAHQARGEDLDATLAAYSTARAPEIAALQELELLQSAMFTPGLGRGDAGAKAALLLRKWLMASYFGLRGMQTAADYKLQVRGGRGCSPGVRF